MKLDFFLNRNGAVKAENRLLRFVVVAIGLVTFINTGLTYQALNYQRTIIVPPGLQGPISIKGNDADEQYLTQFSRYVANLAFTYTPGTIRKQYEELLLIYDPQAYPKGKTTLYELASRVEDTRVSSVFYPHKFIVDIKTNTIELQGNRQQFADERQVDSGNKTYVIEYRMNDGKFMVENIYERDKS